MSVVFLTRTPCDHRCVDAAAPRIPAPLPASLSIISRLPSAARTPDHAIAEVCALHVAFVCRQFCAMMSKRAAALPAAAVLLALAVRIGSRLVLRWRRAKRYDGLDSAVSVAFSPVSPCADIQGREHQHHAGETLGAFERSTDCSQRVHVSRGALFCLR